MTDEKWNKELNIDKIAELLDNMRLGMGLLEDYYKEKRNNLIRMKKQQERRQKKEMKEKND